MSRGFTLAELLIVIAIAVVLFLAAGLFRPSERLQTLELERATELVRGELVRAREDTSAGLLDTPWGVSFRLQTITRFAGTSFENRNPQYDITYAIDAPVTLGGVPEIVFRRPQGVPDAPGSVTISNGVRATTITVNAAGAISIE